jgi:hypothetical protein
MTDEQRPDIQLGTGAPRSELESEPAEPNVAGEDRPTLTPMVRNDSLADPGMVTAVGVGSHPALADEVEPNRSGSGGSGGPVDPDAPAQEEGSGGQSMDQMLGGGADAQDHAAETRGGTPDPRGY